MNGRWMRRLRYWLRRNQRSRQVAEEMQFHLQMKIEELEERGMPEAEARDAARREMGNATLQREEARATWIARWLTDLAQDTAFAARTIRKQPGFAALAVLSTALGIGACSTIFAVANFALFRPLPIEDALNLESISGKNLRRGKTGGSLAYPDFEDLGQARSFQGMTAFFPFMPATISSNGEPQRYWASLVTANYFEVVRPKFAIGRGFDSIRDDRPGEAPVVVLSYHLWRSRFGADPAIVGRSIDLNRRKVTVVGVTGPGFRGTEAMFVSDLWLPFSMMDALAEAGMRGDRLHDRGSQWVNVVGRLRDGATPTEAASEIDVIGKRLGAAYPATNQERAFHMERAGQINPGFRKMIVAFFVLLLSVAVLLLCTACANVANLLLARASARQKEIATRLAIGAGRGRLVRQLLTESVLLALLGGLVGYAIAELGARSLGNARIPLSLPVDLSVALDYRVVLFSIALSMITGVLFGLVPALRATRPDLSGALKEEGVRFGKSRRLSLRNVLVVAQVTTCMVLLICSGLFLRSLAAAQNIDTGLGYRNVLLLAFDPSLNRYSPGETRRVLDGILETTRGMAGIEAASLTSSLPLNMEGTQNSFTPAGDGGDRESSRILADIYSVSPGFFETLGIRIIDGEDFRPGLPSEDIVMVNQALVERAFPRQNAVGQRISYQGRTLRITGLVATTKSRTIGEEPRPCLYFPIARDSRGNDSLTGITLVLRTSGDPSGYANQVRQAIHGIDPGLALFDVRTLQSHLSKALFLPRAAAFLFGLAGVLGLLISTVGIYGVISFTVASQTKEIGVRMALGARRAAVLGMILRRGVAMAAAGCALGVGIALALNRMASSLLYGIRSTDTVTFVAVPLFLLAVAAVACLVPARRAASLDPLRALRYE